MPARNEKWRQELEPRALAVIESVQLRHLARLGYLTESRPDRPPVDPVTTPVGPEPA